MMRGQLLLRRLLRSSSAIQSTQQGVRYYSHNTNGGFAGIHQTPLVQKLWSIREELKRKQPANAEKACRVPEDMIDHSALTSATTLEFEKQRSQQRPILEKTPAESTVEVTYSFSTDEILKDKYMNPFGFIRVGRIIEDLDALAGTIAFRHCDDGNGSAADLLIVTASFDRIKLKHRANLEDDITLSGHVTYTGRSSMEIRMKAVSSWTHKHWLEANFTFVAIDRITKKPVEINKLVPTTEEEKRLHALASQRVAERKCYSRLPYTERTLFNSDTTIYETAKALLRQSQSLVEFPSLAAANNILLQDTKTFNSMVMQPQQRNTAKRIFGGFLVRRAYELAYASTYQFAGILPLFREVDKVSFLMPVDIGNLVKLESCVLYLSADVDVMPTVHIEVTANIIRPEELQSDCAATFNFTFGLPKLDINNLKQICPTTMEEAYKIIERYDEDLRQHHEDQAN